MCNVRAQASNHLKPISVCVCATIHHTIPHHAQFVQLSNNTCAGVEKERVNNDVVQSAVEVHGGLANQFGYFILSQCSTLQQHRCVIIFLSSSYSKLTRLLSIPLVPSLILLLFLLIALQLAMHELYFATFFAYAATSE